MKTSALALLWLLSLAVGSAAAVTRGPAAPKAGGAAPAVAKEEKEPVIEGYVIARKAGGFLGLQVVDGNFKLSFYDTKKKPVAPDVARGTARWNPPQKTGSALAVLNPGSDGTSLVGNKFVRPPLNFMVFLTLLNAAGEVTEAYPVNLAAGK